MRGTSLAEGQFRCPGLIITFLSMRYASANTLGAVLRKSVVLERIAHNHKEATTIRLSALSYVPASGHNFKGADLKWNFNCWERSSNQ